MELFPYVVPDDFQVRNAVPDQVDKLSPFDSWQVVKLGDQFDTQFGDSRRIVSAPGVVGAYRGTIEDFASG